MGESSPPILFLNSTQERFHVGRVAHARPHVGIQAQRLSDGDVQALEAAALGRGDGGLEEHLRAAQAFPCLRGNARTVAGQVLLLARGRETRDEIAARISRASYDIPQGLSVIDVVNDGPLDQGVARFLAALQPASA